VANIVLVLDRDVERRGAYMCAAADVIAPVSGLKVGTCGSGPVGVVWAASANAPVGSIADEAGGAVLWGDAIPGPGPQRWTVEDLRAEWGRPGVAKPCDGFHAAAVWDASGEIRLGADILGVFPLYWWSDGEVLLAGTSAELFLKHPRFAARLDPEGLVGILLTNGLVAGRTLWRGVRRLGPGRMLRGRTETGLREEEQYELPLSTQYFDLPFGAHVELLGEAVRDAVKRHVPGGESYGMLLSGGLDSRMLAGYLRELLCDIDALTLGRSADFEMQCARLVAKAIGASHAAAQIDPNEYPMLADTVTRWEHMANGFSSVPDWGMCAPLGQLPRRTIMGYMADSIVGGSHISMAYDNAKRAMRFECLFDRLFLKWGLGPQVLKQLLPAEDFRSAVDPVIASMEKEYFSQPSHQSWCLDLRTRQRMHVGITTWIASFGSWPVLPVLDRRLISVAAGLPAASLADRRLQKELVIARFPDLAALPLDRNSPDTRPLQPRLRHHLADFVRGRFNGYGNRGKGGNPRQDRDRRFYYRLYDINGSGWRAVRRHAEPQRSQLQEICNPAALDALWPPADRSPQFADGISGSSGLKLMLGLALFSRDHSLDLR
jgi:asparagine synthase (glutamine-hydrolysing)